MKQIILLFSILPLLSYSQNVLQVSDYRSIYMEKVIKAPTYNKQQLYDITLSWVSEVFISPNDVVSFNDPQMGKIKGTFTNNYKISLSSTAWSNTFTIQVKEGRLKIKLSNIRNIQYNAGLEAYILKNDYSFRKYSGLTADVQSSLNDLIINFEKYIKNYSSSEDDW